MTVHTDRRGRLHFFKQIFLLNSHLPRASTLRPVTFSLYLRINYIEKRLTLMCRDIQAQKFTRDTLNEPRHT